MRHTFLTDCVGSNDGPGLGEMVDREIDITRRTFLKHVDREQLAELEQGLGYEKHHTQGLTMAADWHVSYHRSKYRGKACYYFRWSGIEHVFVPEGGGAVSGAYGSQVRTMYSRARAVQIRKAKDIVEEMRGW